MSIRQFVQSPLSIPSFEWIIFARYLQETMFSCSPCWLSHTIPKHSRHHWVGRQASLGLIRGSPSLSSRRHAVLGNDCKSVGVVSGCTQWAMEPGRQGKVTIKPCHRGSSSHHPVLVVPKRYPSRILFAPLTHATSTFSMPWEE